MDDKKAEPPAAPAAATKGSSGKQQLAAATTLTRAPTLANTVLRVVLDSFTMVVCLLDTGDWSVEAPGAVASPALHAASLRRWDSRPLPS